MKIIRSIEANILFIPWRLFLIVVIITLLTYGLLFIGMLRMNMPEFIFLYLASIASALVIVKLMHRYKEYDFEHNPNYFQSFRNFKVMDLFEAIFGYYILTGIPLLIILYIYKVVL
tara:strand:- start:21176 stop:21523 length:348 start_codon:yes stop_codon:yes gene_type:complete